MALIGYPNAKVLDEFIQKIPFDESKLLGRKIAPIVGKNAHEVEWNAIYGGVGLAHLSNLDVDPQNVSFPKVVKMKFEPAYIKEKSRINESDLLKIARLEGTPYEKATKEEIVAVALANLKPRLYNRIEYLIFQALLNGAISIDEDNIKFTVDYGISASNLAKTVSVAWSSPSSAKPVYDIQGIQEAFIPTGFRLGKIISNSYTAKLFCNATDSKTYNGAGIVEKVVPGNLEKFAPTLFPGVQWHVYDGGYSTTSDFISTFNHFIPNNKIIFIGDSMDGDIIDFVTVPSLHKQASGLPQPGEFAFLHDKSNPDDITPSIDVVMGCYGLPRIKRPEPIMVMDVTST